MKRFLTDFLLTRLMLLPVMLTIAGCSFTGCVENDEPTLEFGKAQVSIEQSGQSTASGFTVVFTPSDNAVSFYYAIGLPGDTDRFENGELDSVSVEGNAPETVVFDSLEPDTEYAVFAKAIDDNGIAGSTAMSLVSTADGSFNIVAQYIGNDNAGVIFNYSSSVYTSLEYYLGEPDDYDAFVNGELETGTFETSLSGSTVLNYLSGLEPSHTYVMYCKGCGLMGETDVRTLEFTTSATGENADVTFDYTNDVYKGTYTLTANDNCAYMDVLYSRKGQYLNESSDIVGSMATWSSIGFEAERISEKVNEREEVTTSLDCGAGREVWVVCYDENDQAQAVRHFEYSTPDYDENAPSSTVTVEVSDITSTGATYTYTPDENTVVFLYETIDGEWYDRQIENNPNFDLWAYMEMNYSFPNIMVYAKELENGTFTWTESSGEPGHKYYAAAFPFNKNGDQGRQEIVLIPYTTTTE